MIDFHSHILPGIDDGSKSVEETLQLLRMLSDQGIKIVCATPHFNADRISVDDFLEKRTASYKSLEGILTDDLPEIRQGAEVAYYEGISRMESLSKLCIEGTGLLLIEMPFTAWTEFTVQEIIQLSCSGNMRIVLAHIERYLPYLKKSVLNRILETDILLQVNASFFNDFPTRRKALKMLKNGDIQLFGSDCHNTSVRPPKLSDALCIVEKKMGAEYLDDMFGYWFSLFKK